MHAARRFDTTTEVVAVRQNLCRIATRSAIW